MSDQPESPSERTAELPPVTEADPSAGRGRGLPLPFAFLVGGLGWWPVGFLPWLLGRGTAAPLSDRLHTPVPLIAGAAPLLISCVLVGGLLAGVLLRLCRGAVLARVLIGLAGLLVAIAACCLRSGRASRAVATDSISQSSFVTLGLIAIIVAVTGVAWLIGLLALAGRTGWVVPGAVLAALAPGWLSSLAGVSVGLNGWSTGVLLGLVLGLAAYRSALALIGWIPAVGLAWFVAPLLTAAVYSQQLIPGLSRGSDLVGELVREVVIPCLQVFGQASLPQNRPLLPWAAALTIGLVGVIAGRVRSGRSPHNSGPTA